MTDSTLNFDVILSRIYKATRTKTQKELAAALGIKQPSVADAKRRCAVPEAWFTVLVEKYKLNPTWLKTGKGEKHLVVVHEVSQVRCTSKDPHFDDLMREIIYTVEFQRDHHPFSGNTEQARRAIVSRHKAWEAEALLLENIDGSINQLRKERARSEGLDCIASHIRHILGDYEKSSRIR